jgi:uncharacterized protein (TIGR03435 family)
MLKMVLVVLGTVAYALWPVHAQKAAPRPAFEVVSIKPALAPAARIEHFRQNPGGIDYRSLTLYQLILKAYGISDYQISIPPGLSWQRWDVMAHAADHATMDQFPVMLQSLLADRFKLQVHRAPQELVAYALVVAKGGPKLVEVGPPAGALGGSALPSGGAHLKGRVTLSLLAQALSLNVKRPVIDMTGMPGVFNISFDYVPDDSEPSGGTAASAGVAGDGGVVAAALPGPSISHAIENALGLKLEIRKIPVDMLIIDHVEKIPTGN